MAQSGLVEPEILQGGNTNAAVVRIGDVVHRAAGPWTPSVHALLNYLEEKGFPAPRVRGLDDKNEQLTYIPGPVVDPDRYDLIEADQELASLFELIRRFHDLAAGFTPPAGAIWHPLGRDPSGSEEVLCHNDLSPWNLIASPDGWVFIDWDTVAPGRRDWELAWALQNLVPLHPSFGLTQQRAGQRIAVALRGYRVPETEWSTILQVVVDRNERMMTQIYEGAERGEPHFVGIHAEGHGEIWQAARDHAVAHQAAWLAEALH